MKFLKSPYELDLIKISNDIYELKLSTICNTVLEIKFDKDYMLSLYGLFYRLFADKCRFAVQFPITNTTNYFSITGELDSTEDFAIITITQYDMFNHTNRYQIVSDLDNEYLEILFTFEHYVADYMEDDEYEIYNECDAIDYLAEQLSVLIDDRQNNLKSFDKA